MLGKEKSSKPSSQFETLIGHDTSLTGDVRFKGVLHIDGKVSGNIIADDDESAVLQISEKGRVEGEVRVPYLEINGELEGDIHASEKCECGTSAKIKGNVYYRILEMASGAAINGSLIHSDATVTPISAAAKE